jgi:alkyl hydroperoxide reductase subunit AhpC
VKKDLCKTLLVWAALLAMPPFSLAQGIGPGAAAPFFRVVSGDDKEFTLAGIKDKAAIIFYETRESKEVNRPLKEELNKFLTELPDIFNRQAVRLAVINCQGVICTGIWKQALRENSLKEGLVIYGDWDGKMAQDYGMKSEDSNFLIIDKKGTVRYFVRGQVGRDKFGEIKNLLRRLIEDGGIP